MAKKQLNTSGVDMSVFQKKGLNIEGVDMSVFDVKKKESGDEVSEPSEEPFSLDTSVDLTQYQEPAKKSVPDERELFLSAFEGEEKEIASKAFDATNKYFSGMGGMTPTQKMRELDSRLKAVQSQYQPEDIASLSAEELEKLEQDYTDVVEATAYELGLRISEDGKITPYEEELQRFKQKLEDNIRLAEKASEKEAGFFENLYLKLGAGYESASANVLDLVGTMTGLNYFESYKSLSEGNRYTAEKLSSLANKYDNTIENYLANGEIGKAAGAAVSGAVESLPGMLPIFINPQYGLYVMSGMSGIDKYREVEESSIPEWEKYYNAFITGASEYAGEKLVTIPILARSKKALLSLGEKRGKQAIENAVKKTVDNNASKLGRMPEWVSEGLSEVATGISTDIVDKVTINPDIEIGGQAVDNFAVGAVMGKIFALPQDVAVARNRLDAREFSRKVIDKLPADMSIDAKISLGWKIAERDALQQAEDKLDEGFKGKYQERIDRLNSEIDAVAADYLGVPVEEVTTEVAKPEVGKVEPVGEMQQKLDYLIERGVEVPDGSKEADVDKLYRQERVKAIKEGNAELDIQIAEAQTRLGLETTPDVEISDDTELTLEQLDNGEPVTNEFLKTASDELYEKYNELEAMKQSDSRVYTTEQIESMQEFLGEEITKLEDYAKEQAETGKFVGETETGEVTERGAEEVIEVKPKIKEDGKEMQEREGAQQGVQKPEDEVAERGKETAEASKKADEEAVVSKEPSLTKQTWEMTESEYDSYVEKNYKTWEELSSKEKAIAKRKYQEDTKDFDEQEKEWEKLVYDKNRDYMVVAINKSDIGTHKSEVMLAMEEGRNIPDDVKEKYPELFKPTTSPQKPSERVSPEKGVTTPPAEKVAETAPTQADIAKLEQTRAKLERETKKAENKERLARIFDNAARLTGARKDVVGDERKQIRKQLIDDVIDYVKTEFELAGQALVDRVKSFVKENNLPVEDLQDNEITKSKSYAEEIGEKVKKPVQEKGTEQKEVRQVRVRDDEKDRVETKPPKEKVRERSFGKTLATAGGFFEKLQHDSPMFYVVRRSQQAIEDAAAWLSERTEGQAYQELKKKHVTSISADRQDRREVFLAYLNEQLNMAVADNDLLRADEVHEMLQTLRVVTSEEYTRAGQVVQTAAHWRSVSQDAVRWSVQHEIDRRNEKEVPYTNVTKLKESGDEVNKMSKEAGKNVTEDERVQQVINEVVNKQKGKIRQTNREKAKVVAQKIRSFKSSNWGITLAAEPISAVGIGVLDGALELTAKTVELSGNVADAIQRGVKHIKQSEWYKDLKEAQKRKIERVFAMNVRKGLGVDKFSKSELEGYLKQEVKDLGQKLNDIIREHWETKNELGVMLSERIIADLGLSEADAKLLENTVQEIINENIEKNIDEFIDPELVPKKEESRKTFIDKMGKLVMRGDLDTKLFREKFAETFGLTPDLTAQQATDIINLHKAVVETADMGIYGDVVADRFAKEVDKLIPQTKTERLLSGMVALDYANMLFGYTTWFVNIMSAAANIAIRPISETLDFVKWYNSIQTARELKSFPVFLSNNPMVDGFRAWIDFAKGVTRISPHSVMDTLLSGGLREMNKYISQVESTAKLRVPELEREVHGRNRFATKLKYKGKTLIDFKFNPFNFMKFSGRFLVAQDVGMFSAFESVELAAKLRKKLLKEGFSEKEISDHINRQVTGAQLTEEQKDSVDKQLEKEGKEMSKLGIKIDLFRRNRRRMEIVREQFLELPEEDLLDAEKAAKGQIYTDTRGGVVNSIMSIIGNLSNKNIYTKLLIMPYFPFVKIFANIGDFVLDTVPAYGWLRYRGYSPSTMWAQYLANKEAGMQQPKAITNAVFGKRRPTKELPFLTAQLGDKGTQARERQRQRAMFGNFVMLPAISVIAGLWAFGKDDDDEPWFDVSGARFDVKDQVQRESVPDRMPPWTIKIGEWRFRYQNKPGLMFPMAMLGFYRDMQRADYSDEEIRDRLKLMGQAFMGSFSAMTDLQIAGGFKDLTESLDRLITTAKAYNEDPTAEDIKTRRYLENFGKYLARKTVTPFTTWLPTKNNLVQQTIQFISEERKESRSIPAILAYNTGIHHWTNRDAIDIFGKTTYSKPGFTQILYKPVLEKRDPQRWKAFEKLFEADAVPAPYWNKMEMVIKNPSASKEGESMYEYQLPTEDEFWTLRQKSGNRFYEDILRYQDSEAWDIEKEKFSGTLTRSRTVLQDKVAKYWNDSKKQTRHYLFTWKEFEDINKDVYAKLYDNAAFPDVVTSVDIPAFDPINETYMYVDEKGQPTILDTVTLGKDEVAELNAMAFRDYIEMLDRLGMEDDFAFKMSAQNLWKQVVQLNTQPFIQKYYDNME